MPKALLLKDTIDRPAVAVLTDAIHPYTGIDKDAFLRDVFDLTWETLELKQRVRHIAAVLRRHLPELYCEALEVLVAAAPAAGNAGLAAWSFCDFVEVYGLDDPDISVPALEVFTKMISAEFAVRPFHIRYPERMAAQHLAWAGHPDPAVRRLATEGIRPRLPWGIAVPHLRQDPSPIFPILHMLRDDASDDVRRSVANNLNDISKDHPELVVEFLSGWDDRRPLVKHALRTLLKNGHAGAMALLGFFTDVSVEVRELAVEPSPAPIDGFTTLRGILTSTASRSQDLMIDFAVTYQNVSGTGSRKVFKGTTATLEASESMNFTRKISLAQRTTRRILPGPHRVELLVNGMIAGSIDFAVVTGSSTQ